MEPDRNYLKGGKSFYFFDFDDNVMFLPSSLYLFHKETNEEIAISTAEFARENSQIGKSGVFREYKIIDNCLSGTYRDFSDTAFDLNRESFSQDVKRALSKNKSEWMGPSWRRFRRAVFNRRSIALITARGHHPDILRNGVHLLKARGYLTHEPNYLGIYPVSYKSMHKLLGGGESRLTIPELKYKAICHAVEEAMRVYGANPYHRFGMSDDDPSNIKLIIQAMREMKSRYPENSFFVISTHKRSMVQLEIFLDHTEEDIIRSERGLDLWDSPCMNTTSD